MKAAIALLLMSTAEARRFSDFFVDDIALQTSTDLEMGLGSLEGAYLAQKSKKKDKEYVWDKTNLVTDNESYSQGLAASMDEQHVDIEFA